MWMQIPRFERRDSDSLDVMENLRTCWYVNLVNLHLVLGGRRPRTNASVSHKGCYHVPTSIEPRDWERGLV
jgi:hypothetical protein